MPQISKGETFTNGEQVTGARLNQLVDSSTLLAGAILDQGAMTANTVAATDSVLLYDLSATALRKPTVSDVLNSNLPVTTSAITGGAGVDIVVTPAATMKFDVAGAFEADSSNIVGNETIGGTLAVTGTSTFTGNATFTAGVGGTSAIKIATGTTAERPASPVAGQLRFNTTSNALEVYSGSAWINGVTSGSATFDGTVNITGAIQYNGTPVYGMYEVVNGGYNSSTGLWSVYTKPSDEIWVVNFGVKNGDAGAGAKPTIYIAPSTYIQGDDIETLYVYLGYENTFSYAYSTLIIPAGTAFTSKAIVTGLGGTGNINGGGYGRYCITKYKTA